MCPAQLSPQCRDNLFIREDFRKMEAMAQLFFTPASTIGLGELPRQGDNDLFAVFSPLALEDFGVNAVADLPVKQGDFGIDGNSSALFGPVDELPNFLK
jgi:hypothetical protein